MLYEYINQISRLLEDAFWQSELHRRKEYSRVSAARDLLKDTLEALYGNIKNSVKVLF